MIFVEFVEYNTEFVEYNAEFVEYNAESVEYKAELVEYNAEFVEYNKSHRKNKLLNTNLFSHIYFTLAEHVASFH